MPQRKPTSLSSNRKSSNKNSAAEEASQRGHALFCYIYRPLIIHIKNFKLWRKPISVFSGKSHFLPFFIFEGYFYPPTRPCRRSEGPLVLVYGPLLTVSGRVPQGARIRHDDETRTYPSKLARRRPALSPTALQRKTHAANSRDSRLRHHDHGQGPAC